MQTGRKDQVVIKFLRDFATTAGSFHCTAGAEHVVDAASASALVLAGVAVKIALSAPD